MVDLHIKCDLHLLVGGDVNADHYSDTMAYYRLNYTDITNELFGINKTFLCFFITQSII